MPAHFLNDYAALMYGKDVLVIGKHFNDKKCVVAFNSRTDETPSNPFAAQFLEASGCSHICVISNSNHWWQTADFDAALKRIAEEIEARGYSEVICYGGSMGGHGAMLASGRLNADRVIVFGAQYSVSPTVVPWDGRWHNDVSLMLRSPALPDAFLSKSSQYIYIYDPGTLDRRHADLFEAQVPLERLALSYSGHAVFETLKELKLAGVVARSLLFDLNKANTRDVIAGIKKEYRRLRHNSSSYWRNIYLRYLKRTSRLKLVALERSHELAPNDIRVLLDIGYYRLTEQKVFAPAYEAFAKCIIINNRHPAAWRGGAKTLLAMGQGGDALEFAVAAYARRPGDLDLIRVWIEIAMETKSRRLLQVGISIYASLVATAVGDRFLNGLPSDVLEYATGAAFAAEQKRSLAASEAAFRALVAIKPFRYSQLVPILMARASSAVLVIHPDADTLAALVASALAVCGQEANAVFVDLAVQPVPAKLEPYLPDSKLTLDVVFLSGNVRLLDLRTWWSALATRLKAGQVVVFDDFVVDDDPENPSPCNQLIAEIEADCHFTARKLPLHDPVSLEPGARRVGLVAITKKA